MTNFVYCFDKTLADELSVKLKLFKTDTVNEKPCWIFIGDNNKLQFNELDKSKVIISNRLNF